MQFQAHTAARLANVIVERKGMQVGLSLLDLRKRSNSAV
jgi:hypothetical protein